MQFLSHIILLTFIIMVVQLQTSYEISIYWGDNVDRVKLTSIQSLTLYSGRMTTARRSWPIPQMKCVGGNAGCQAAISVIQCHNQGTTVVFGSDVLWKCRANNMNRHYRFGRTDINCEGYDYPNDPYILRGSCGVEYTLYLRHEPQMGRGNSVGILIFMCIIFAVFIALVLIFCSSVDQGGSREHYYQSPPRPYIRDEVVVVNRPRVYGGNPPSYNTGYHGYTPDHTTNRRYYGHSSPDPSNDEPSTTGFGNTKRR